MQCMLKIHRQADWTTSNYRLRERYVSISPEHHSKHHLLFLVAGGNNWKTSCWCDWISYAGLLACLFGQRGSKSNKPLQKELLLPSPALSLISFCKDSFPLKRGTNKHFWDWNFSLILGRKVLQNNSFILLQTTQCKECNSKLD